MAGSGVIDIAATTLKMKEAGLSVETILLALGCIVLCAPAVERSGAALRQAAYRERVKGHNALRNVHNVDNGDGQESFPHTPFKENNLSVVTPPVSPPSKSSDPEGFAEFWAAYPRRSGSVDRKPAAKAFRAALTRADLETILHGAKRYAADMQATGKLGTEYVKQARTWLNADGWAEYGTASTNPTPVKSGVYVQYGTDPGDAWERYYRTKGKVPPRDFKGGWYFPSEYPQEAA